MRLGYLLVLSLYVVLAYSQCSYTDATSGNSWDLTDLQYDSSATEFPTGYSFQSGTNTFYINFCSPVSSAAIGDTGNKCSSAGSCQLSDQYYNAGQASGYTFAPYYASGTATNGTDPDGVALTYSNGNVCQSINKGRISHIWVVCPTNGQATNQISNVVEESTCNYDITFYSDNGCVGGGSGGGVDPGWIILLFLSFFFFVYVAIGVPIKFKKYEARGLDLVPNYDFWKDVPFLLKDATVFTIQKVTCNKVCAGYSEI